MHMRNFSKLVRTIPCIECREKRLTALEHTIDATEKPRKKALRKALTALRETPMMQVLSEKHNGLASTITFTCSECEYKSKFNTSPSFRLYKFRRVINTVPLKAANADNGKRRRSGRVKCAHGTTNLETIRADMAACQREQSRWRSRRRQRSRMRGKRTSMRSPKCHRKYSARICAANLICEKARNGGPRTR